MSEDPGEGFWATLCGLQPFFVVGGSLSALLALASVLVVVGGGMSQQSILMVNLAILTPVAVLSAAVLAYCRIR